MQRVRAIMWWVTDIVSVVFFLSTISVAGFDSFTLTDGEMEFLIYATFIATAYNMTYKIPNFLNDD